LPEAKLLAKWNAREHALIATDPTRVPGLANPPFAPTAHAGRAKGDAKAKVGAEGARTVPPREHGGNCDIKDLSRGSKIYFPVYVPGGGLSMGDLHFSQGHISGVVDVPNACATLWLPTEIFDFDVMPSSAGPIKHIKGDIQMPLSPDK